MTHPDRFGVFSTPVVNLLYVNCAKTVDLYTALCDELSRWKDHFDIASVAQTEMALWAFNQLTSPPLHGADVENARREFESDVWIQRRLSAPAVASP